jgi:hypothetical protein
MIRPYAVYRSRKTAYLKSLQDQKFAGYCEKQGQTDYDHASSPLSLLLLVIPGKFLAGFYPIAKKGNYAGQQFWACSANPKCKMIEAITA